SNFDRVGRTFKEGDRTSDPNYDGINVYGDEINTNILAVSRALQAGFQAQSPQGFGGVNALINMFPDYNYDQYVATITAPGSPFGALAPAIPYLGIVKGIKGNTISNQNVSRTGYEESNLVDYNTQSMKASGAAHYKFTPTIE